MCRREILLLLSAPVFILAVQMGCSRKPVISDPNIILPKCAQRMQMKFPPSTRFLGFAEGTGQDYSARLKFEIDIDDLEFFIRNSPFAGKELRSDRTYVSLSAGKKWWTAGRNSKTYKSGFTNIPSRYAEPMAILIDLDRPEKAVIYLSYRGRPLFQDE